jgi:hypothetical protein
VGKSNSSALIHIDIVTIILYMSVWLEKVGIAQEEVWRDEDDDGS